MTLCPTYSQRNLSILAGVVGVHLLFLGGPAPVLLLPALLVACGLLAIAMAHVLDKPPRLALPARSLVARTGSYEEVSDSMILGVAEEPQQDWEEGPTGEIPAPTVLALRRECSRSRAPLFAI